MSGPQRPEYRANDLTPGQRYFDCHNLRATISTGACAQRWRAAVAGSACCGCTLGRLHNADHHPEATISTPQRRHGDGPCLRCGRMGLRIIKQTGICVSCAAREAEWRKGRNSKGTPPIRFVPLHEVEIAERAPDGRVRRRLVLALDMAEALGRVVRDLPQGARVVTGERCHTAWNHATGRFHHVCEHCGAAGLVLERRRGDVLERHYWCCGGDPVGRGWDVAQVRQRVVSMPPEALADWLSARSELADEVPGLWTTTGMVCDVCHAGQLEGLLTETGGRWRTRCRGCGARVP